ncbi:hypothetical protein EVAR_62369_1 [Eumeta japonica]|uniref:Uncharacterized protein n=1 Tax=Eumeta variegata TaxID=151549 RepID=A0A4C2A496_EUMVA|nr:hypothetical protein EVAR_62369_1 [Eumeta japonica]
MPSVAVVALSSDSIRTGSMSPNVTDFGFAYLPLEGQVLHQMRRLHSERRLGRISYPHASHKLPRRSSPAQANFRSSFHSYRGPTCVDDVPVSDDRLVGAPIDVSFSCSAVFILRALVTRLLSIFKFNSSIFNP